MGDAEQPSSSVVLLAASEGWTISVFSVVQAVSAAAVGIVFCLYAIGFVIMNSFLGRFGLKAGAVFTFDYVAAALCYLIFLAAVAVPVWTIYFGIMRWIQRKHEALSNWLWATIVVWNALIYVFRQLYFPESYLRARWLWASTSPGDT